MPGKAAMSTTVAAGGGLGIGGIAIVVLAGGLLVRQELQADCYAGVWAHHAQARHQWLIE